MNEKVDDLRKVEVWRGKELISPRRVLDADPLLERDPQHELMPVGAPPVKTGGQMIIEQTIEHLDKATEIVLATLDALEAEIVRTREIVQKSKLEAHDIIRSHMIISEMAMKSAQQIAQQLVESTKSMSRKGGG
jgi:hypothetical protein